MVKILFSKVRNLQRTAYKQCTKFHTVEWQTYAGVDRDSRHLRDIFLKTTSTAPCGLEWPVAGSRRVEVVDLCSEEGWETLLQSFWLAEALRNLLNLSKLSGREGHEQQRQVQAGRSQHFSGWLAQDLSIRGRVFFKDYFYSTLSKALGHSWIKDALQTNEPGGGLFSFLWADGTPVVDKGAADHTHRVLRREHAGGCCVFSGDLGGKLCKTERLIPTTENERNRNILSGTPHLPLGLWFSKSKREKNSQKNKNTTAKWTFEGQHAHLRVRF